ncbi:MAG: AIR carboxylase family protein, partial [Nocardioides sp.]|uniref:AIR carboxylase family protein n=1 Tax=Nocardioides sp. TaxID=35761 RepID=UPI0032673C67
VQMPAGIPVATVAIGNARNAGILAARILGTSDEALQHKLVEFEASLVETARAKGQVVRDASSGAHKVGF